MQTNRFDAKQNNFEGVVAIHVMTNGLVAAVHTSGILTVIKLVDFSVIFQIDLLSENKEGCKLFDAKLCSKTCISSPSTYSIDKNIRLCVAYGSEVNREFGKSWNIANFDLTF